MRYYLPVFGNKGWTCLCFACPSYIPWRYRQFVSQKIHTTAWSRTTNWSGESLNDPVADARQAAALFADEFQSFKGLRQKEPRLFDVLHFLLATPDHETDQLSKGMAFLFRALGAIPQTKARVLELCRAAFIPQWGCADVPIDEATVN